MDGLTTAPDRDAQQQLEELKLEIDRRASQNEEARDLWIKYVEAYLEANSITVANATDFANLSEEIIASASDIKIELSIPDVERLTEAALEARADGEPFNFDSAKRSVEIGADPVMMFNGQFLQEATDLKIDGAGINFAFKRAYKNQTAYNGPLGFGWDHSYNLRLRVAGEIIFCSTGILRDDLYTRHPLYGQAGFNYWVPPDGQHGVIIETQSSFALRLPGGTRYIYEPDPTRDTHHRIERIEDKHGNYLVFRYRDQEDNQLGQVEINHPARLVRFDYEEEGRIKAVTDHTGRAWHYLYDALGDLVAVTTPTTPEHPEGLTTFYEYSSAHASGALQHNLTRIIDAEGQTYLENEYGVSANLLSFNRVIRQRQGSGESLFEYEDVVEEFAIDYSDSERPAHQTILVGRNGQAVLNIYNRAGNLILKEERIVQGGLVKTLRWHYRYNADGALIGEMTPDGSVTQYLYGRDYYMRRHNITDAEVPTHDRLTDVERLAFANLLAVVKRGRRYGFAGLNLGQDIWGDIFPDIFVTDADDIITKFGYEPNFNQPKTSSDPRYTRSADPAHTQPPHEDPRHRDTLTVFEYTAPDGAAYPAPVGTPQPDTQNLYLRRVRRPNALLPDGATQDNITEEFTRYDGKGRLVAGADAEGNVKTLEYFGASDGVREGYLKSETLDPNGLDIRTSYEVNEAGIVTATVRPKARGAPPGFFRTTSNIDALDQVTKVVTSLPFAYETRFFYDRNRLLARSERDLKDENNAAILGGAEVKLYRYDEQLNLTEESTGGTDIATHLLTRNCFNSSDKLTRTTLPRGNQIWFTYDERLLQTSITHGACTPDEVTTRVEYDIDGLPARRIDGKGKVTRLEYDAFGRLIAVTDPLGHVRRLDYDKADNLIVERFFERREDGGFSLLSRAEYGYDELNRRIIERRNLFAAALPATNLDSDFLGSPGPGASLEWRTFYDRKGRVVKTVNAKNQERVFEFDKADRLVKETDAAGNYVQYFFDPHGNLVRRDSHELVVDPATGQTIGEDVFSTFREYDELDRLTKMVDSLGNTNRFFYDSRNKLVRHVDPLGNVRRLGFDVHNRKVLEAVEITSTGLGAGTRLPDIVTRFEYDENGNLIALTDAKNNTTTQEFDQLDRRIRQRFPDGTSQRYVFDKAHNISSHVDNNGLTRRYKHDAMNRLIHTSVDFSTTGGDVIVGGASFEDFEFDGAGRPVKEENDFTAIERIFDSLGRPYEETQHFNIHAGPVALTRSYRLRREMDELGSAIRLIYPSRRAILYHLDALNRITRIENVTKGDGYPGSNTFPDRYDILTHQHRGVRRAGTVFGNGASAGYAFDKAARLIEITHRAGDGATLLAIQHLYDAAGNMRLKNESVAATARGETYKYNSHYWLTRIEESNSIPLFSAAALGPFNAPPSPAVLNGQSQIDALIGNINDDPSDFTLRYDALGNRQEERQAGQPGTTYVANRLNQYTGVGANTLEYDLNGNLIKDATRRYVYDFRNQLIGVDDLTTGEKLAEFFYDTQARRILSVTGGHATHFIFDGQNVVEEYRGDLLFAQYVQEHALDSVCQIAAENKEHWYHKDLVNSTRLLTDETGAAAGRYRYSPFGQHLEASGPFNPLRFSCLRFDEPIDSYNCRIRQYLPSLARFMQRDIIPSRNLYTFLENNPLTAIDPLGTERMSTHADEASVLEIAVDEMGNVISEKVEAVKAIPEHPVDSAWGFINPIGRVEEMIGTGINATVGFYYDVKKAREQGKGREMATRKSVSSAAAIFTTLFLGRLLKSKHLKNVDEIKKALPPGYKFATKKEIQRGFDELASKRKELKLPPVDPNNPSTGTLSLLEVGDIGAYGINRGFYTHKFGKEERLMTTYVVNAITRHHAEGDAFERAKETNVSANTARLWVDRELCPSCGDFGGVKSMARQLGIEWLEVYTPNGQEVWDIRE